MGKYPDWRTMTAAQRHNARQDAIWEAARDAKTRFNVSSRNDGPASDTVAQGERASASDYDPTCIFCQNGEEPGHDH